MVNPPRAKNKGEHHGQTHFHQPFARAAHRAADPGAATRRDHRHGGHHHGHGRGRTRGFRHFPGGRHQPAIDPGLFRAGHGRRRGGGAISGRARTRARLRHGQAVGLVHDADRRADRPCRRRVERADFGRDLWRAGAERNGKRAGLLFDFGHFLSVPRAVQRGCGALPLHGQQPDLADHFADHERGQRGGQRAAHLRVRYGRIPARRSLPWPRACWRR